MHVRYLELYLVYSKCSKKKKMLAFDLENSP